MEYQAKWGTKGFVTSTTKLVPLMDFKATMAVKSESQSDSSGTSKTNVKGKEPEIVTFNTRYLTAAGVDPWGQVEEWRSLLGKSNPLYIGGKRFGPAKFMLKSAEVSETLLSPTGAFIGLKLTLTLEEDTSATTKKTTTTKKSATPSDTTATTTEDTTKVGIAAVTGGMNAIQRAAMLATPVDEERAEFASLMSKREETEAKASTKSTSTTLSSKVSTVQYQGKTYPVKYWAKYGDWIRGFFYHPVISVDGKDVTVYSYKLVQ